MEHFDGYAHINCGAGYEVPIRELAETVKEAVGFKDPLVFDTAKPDGVPRKLMDSSRLLAMGWKPEISLKEGIKGNYVWFLEHLGPRLIRRTRL